MAAEQKGQVIAIGSSQPATGGTRQSMEGGNLRAVARAESRGSRVRFCEGLGVKVAEPTRHSRKSQPPDDELRPYAIFRAGAALTNYRRRRRIGNQKEAKRLPQIATIITAYRLPPSPLHYG